MSPEPLDRELADLALTVGAMVRSVADRWKVRLEAGRLDGHGLDAVVRFTRSLDAAASVLEGLEEPLASATSSTPTIADSEERFRLLVDGVLDYGIFMLDPTGHVSSWNAGAERISGYRAEEIIDRHFSIFSPPADVERGKPARDLDIASRVGRVGEEGWRLRKDGTLYWASVNIVALRDAEGRLRGFGNVTRDMTELRAVTEEARRSEERMRIMIEAVRDYAIFMLDPQGNVASWNVGAERLKGYRASEIVGQHFSVFYSEEDRLRGHPDAELRIAKVEGRYEEEGWRYRKDGSRFWANVVLTALFDEGGRHIGFTKVTRDFTDARRLREAQLGLQVRDDFISIASHELRTPLTALLMHIESLQRTARPDDSAPRLRERLGKSARAGERLQHLLDQMLDVSRISGGHLQLEPIPVPLDEAVREVAERFEQAPLRLDLQAGIVGRWDPIRLDQVITNLLSNAVKYGRGQPVDIAVSAEGGMARLVVKDQGIGIARDKLERIFEAFERAVQERQFGGFGLGLWIAKRFVEASGGQIRVESELGVGSTFTVELPLEGRPQGIEDAVR